MVGRQRISSILLAFTTVVSCAALIYTVDERQQAVARNTYWTHCLSEWTRESSGTSAARSEASQERDDALVASKKALSRLIYLRVIKGVDSSPEVDEVAREYMEQTRRFIEKSEALNKTRRDEPIPMFEDYCRQKFDR